VRFDKRRPQTLELDLTCAPADTVNSRASSLRKKVRGLDDLESDDSDFEFM